VQGQARAKQPHPGHRAGGAGARRLYGLNHLPPSLPPSTPSSPPGAGRPSHRP
jgi:hypothetical protein